MSKGARLRLLGARDRGIAISSGSRWSSTLSPHSLRRIPGKALGLTQQGKDG